VKLLCCCQSAQAEAIANAIRKIVKVVRGPISMDLRTGNDRLAKVEGVTVPGR
jgi:hypothetical protein